MSKRALVIGAQGTLGAAVAQCLHREGWHVLRAGRRGEEAADFCNVDLDRPETLIDPLEEVDLAVNCILHPELTPQRIVLERGGTMLDVASLPRVDADALRAAGTSAHGLVVIDAGLNPGLTTLVLADLLAEHPDADGLELVNTLSARQSTGANAMGFFMPFLTGTAHRPTAMFPLPQPFGKRHCLQVSNGEEGWLASLAEDRAGRVYVCFRERVVHAGLLIANALHLLSRVRPVRLPHGEVGREGLTLEPKADWVGVTRGRERLAARTIEGRGDYLLTVQATVVFADALREFAQSRPELRGLHGAEALFRLPDLREAFAERGIHIRDQPAAA